MVLEKGEHSRQRQYLPRSLKRLAKVLASWALTRNLDSGAPSRSEMVWLPQVLPLVKQIIFGVLLFGLCKIVASRTCTPWCLLPISTQWIDWNLRVRMTLRRCMNGIGTAQAELALANTFFREQGMGELAPSKSYLCAG